jgi:hypothetical protein
VLIEVNVQLLRSVEDIVAVHAAGEGFVLELFPDTRDFDIADGLAGLDEGARGEKARELVAGEESLVQVRRALRAGVFGVAEDGMADLLGPATLFKDADADPRMLIGRGKPLVVEIVQQTSGAVEINQARGIIADQSATVRLLLAVSADATFDSECVLEQAGALGELGE